MPSSPRLPSLANRLAGLWERIGGRSHLISRTSLRLPSLQICVGGRVTGSFSGSASSPLVCDYLGDTLELGQRLAAS